MHNPNITTTAPSPLPPHTCPSTSQTIDCECGRKIHIVFVPVFVPAPQPSPVYPGQYVPPWQPIPGPSCVPWWQFQTWCSGAVLTVPSIVQHPSWVPEQWPAVGVRSVTLAVEKGN